MKEPEVLELLTILQEKRAEILEVTARHRSLVVMKCNCRWTAKTQKRQALRRENPIRLHDYLRSHVAGSDPSVRGEST